MAAVTVRLFAGLRERAGQGRVELDGVAVLADVWPALALGDEPPGMLYAVNREYAEPTQELRDGDEVALIPPSPAVRSSSPRSRSTSPPPSPRWRPTTRAGSPRSSARCRSSSRGRDVQYLEYEAYEEMAEPMLHRLGEELKARHGLAAVAIHHRVGRVEIGEPSVVIAVSAAHRAAALDACREAIDTLKETIPLWKKEVYAGGEEWIGQGS